MQQPSLNIVLSGGGTGGHIYPAIAIANTLKERYPEANFLFIGARDKMEMEKVPAAGYPIKGLWISGLQRKKTSLKNLLFPLKLLASVIRSYFILRSFKAQVVIGTGGFASGPALWVATRIGIPTLVQEQNSFPGITNKLLSKYVNTICVAYDEMERFFPKEKIVHTGNPVRQDLADSHEKKAEAMDFFGLDKNKKTILALGGSLGAKMINRNIQKVLGWFKEKDIQLLWQTGRLYIDEALDHASKTQHEGIHTQAFISRMDLAYAAADIVLSRAGASTISELCLVGKAAILIPSPNVAEDHQTKNARALEEKKAAILLNEKEMDVYLTNYLELLLNDDEKREKLRKNSARMAAPDASKKIVNEIMKLIKKS